ncbi:MAG: hypothetical protein WC895_02750 [Candidatus Shapirobacteria bacterium]|jgi:hypothetical protein
MVDTQPDTEKFKKITTGNGFQNDLIATNIDRLEMTVNALNHLEDVLSNELLLTRVAIDQLEGTIKKANNKNDKLQKWFLIIAIIGTFLTATQLIQVWDILARGIGK